MSNTAYIREEFLLNINSKYHAKYLNVLISYKIIIHFNASLNSLNLCEKV